VNSDVCLNYKVKMCSIKNLPPKPFTSNPKSKSPTAQGSRLLRLQASFQAKQLEEKEDKLINYLESKTIKSSYSSRENLRSGNSLTSSSSCTSLYGEKSTEYGVFQDLQNMNKNSKLSRKVIFFMNKFFFIKILLVQ